MGVGLQTRTFFSGFYCIYDFSLAENFELLGSLLTKLQWIISCIMYGDANELLAYYKDCQPRVPQNVSETLSYPDRQLALHPPVYFCLAYGVFFWLAYMVEPPHCVCS